MAAATVEEAEVCTLEAVDSMAVVAASKADTAVAITADIQVVATAATDPMRARTDLTLVPMDLTQVPGALILVSTADTVAPTALRPDGRGHGKARRLGTFPPDGISLILVARGTPHAAPHHPGQ
ncbi:MAG TPA: hypothetical protein VMS18_03205 [Candidatus Binatia bacterium]|nr:hypothetical protein [Candidatus Binatia bacterium]